MRVSTKCLPTRFISLTYRTSLKQIRQLDICGDSLLVPLLRVIRRSAGYAKPASHLRAIPRDNFVNDCDGVDKVNYTCEAGLTSRSGDCRYVYKRPKVGELQKKIHDHIFPPNNASGKLKLRICGSSGIGKSLVSFCSAVSAAAKKNVLWCSIWKMEDIVNVILFPVSTGDAICATKLHPEDIMPMVNQIDANHEECVVFFDGVNKNLKGTDALVGSLRDVKVVEVASGKAETVSKKDLDQSGRDQNVHESWTKEEYESLLEKNETLEMFVESPLDVTVDVPRTNPAACPFVDGQEPDIDQMKKLAKEPSIDWNKYPQVKQDAINLMKAGEAFKNFVIRRKYFFAGSNVRWFLNFRLGKIMDDVESAVERSDKDTTIFGAPVSNTAIAIIAGRKRLISNYLLKVFLRSPNYKFDRAKLCKTIYDFAKREGENAMRGIVFEQYIKEVFKKASAIDDNSTVRFGIVNDNHVTMNLPVSHVWEYNQPDEFLNKDAVIAVPINKFNKGFDMLSVFRSQSVSFIQVTVAQSHPIITDAMVDVVEAAKKLWDVRKVGVKLYLLGDDSDHFTNVRRVTGKAFPNVCYKVGGNKTERDFMLTKDDITHLFHKVVDIESIVFRKVGENN